MVAMLYKSLSGAALISTIIALSSAPSAVQASGNNGHMFVYFTRHAEKQTVTLNVFSTAGNSATYTTDPDGSYSTTSGEHKKGTRLDEVCGLSKCAEELSDAGELRAELLAQWFSQRGIVKKLDAVYATHKVRTQQTVTPTADLAGLEVIQVPYFQDDGMTAATELNPESTTPSECATLDAIAAAQAAGMDTILVAGHSGTLYDIMGDGNDNCAGLGLDTSNADRFPVDTKGKVRDYGDIWRVLVRPDGTARFLYRRNLQPIQMRVVNQAK